ncbi:hypothetical protein C8J57DRAFT_1539190 [Mycena rebaudengoi]|nr:hypothetical protein C8J57DRAFT_1539190 [Mycena rebaudengoi]
MSAFNILDCFQHKGAHRVPTQNRNGAYEIWHIHYSTRIRCSDLYATAITAEFHVSSSGSSETLAEGAVLVLKVPTNFKTRQWQSMKVPRRDHRHLPQLDLRTIHAFTGDKRKRQCSSIVVDRIPSSPRTSKSFSNCQGLTLDIIGVELL